MALAAMRRHRRWLYGFLWIVILAFVILYVPALRNDFEGTPSETVVSVGGLKVSLGEYQRAYKQLRDRYAQVYQGRLDENTMRQLGLEGQVLEALVSDRLVELEAKRLGVAVSDEAVAHAIVTLPAFQDGGRFVGKDEIRRRLELSGESEEDVRELAAPPDRAREPGGADRGRRPGERRERRSASSGGAPSSCGSSTCRSTRPATRRRCSRATTSSRPASRRSARPTRSRRSAWSPTCCSTGPRCSRRWR